MRALKCSCSVLASFSFFSFALALGASPSEHFSEVLKIRPLRDGKVVSTFLFTSDLRGAPRDPASLAFEDERMSSQNLLLLSFLTIQLARSSALQALSVGTRSNSTRIRGL
jgi:phosphatidylinositol glycan class T